MPSRRGSTPPAGYHRRAARRFSAHDTMHDFATHRFRPHWSRQISFIKEAFRYYSLYRVRGISVISRHQLGLLSTTRLPSYAMGHTYGTLRPSRRFSPPRKTSPDDIFYFTYSFVPANAYAIVITCPDAADTRAQAYMPSAHLKLGRLSFALNAA